MNSNWKLIQRPFNARPESDSGDRSSDGGDGGRSGRRRGGPPSPNSGRLKLLCSYGGKILPRPLDGQLKYVGGETRVLAVPRSVSFAELKGRIGSMFEAREVAVKYQLAPEELDVLVSVTCDEDLAHMLDEYDRSCCSSSPSASPRFRLFLFPLPLPSPPPTATWTAQLRPRCSPSPPLPRPGTRLRRPPPSDAARAAGCIGCGARPTSAGPGPGPGPGPARPTILVGLSSTTTTAPTIIIRARGGTSEALAVLVVGPAVRRVPLRVRVPRGVGPAAAADAARALRAGDGWWWWWGLRVRRTRGRRGPPAAEERPLRGADAEDDDLGVRLGTLLVITATYSLNLVCEEQ
uniref:PB1 domain-containing protein n=1 Tax=Ananas comosus var. bracteatus TaxID=296719 RepID=A0A6V7NHR9_ANACO|nr:unnamed protein product [Ananas comosus var. bracteatus]